MNDPFTLVGVTSSSVKLVSQSKEADSAAIHDVSFFPLPYCRGCGSSGLCIQHLSQALLSYTE